ncbi:MAG: hypothetical protein RR138_00155 [Akkermansia sp.]
MEEDLLTIEEKRIWLADIFRNISGDYSQADRFKALTEDTKLALIQQEIDEKLEEQAPRQDNPLLSLLNSLPPPNPVNHQ